ncbi:ABC transporter permease subunit [Senegalia massiliensis]|uniref:ABC transporter permease subunit n=1 Tax=Senegalia massiliensis TaxID=1720316 RepID=A0A845QWF8_9CLOT|nr:ABC transporter permease subunit [Senegalia massiliensis]NBI06324.1 ABC transporter permease subunit [Senegalia massiliensis]
MLYRLKKINLPLVIGIIILIFISIIAIFRIDIMNLDPFATNFALPHFEDGNLVIDNPPNPPDDINIWGTDILGRDVFSRIVYGARMTLQIGIYTAIARLIVGLILGLFAGFGSKIISKIIDIFKTTFSAIPALIISFILLSAIKPTLEEVIFIYTFILTFVGWGRIGSILRDRINEILREDFIKGEIAIGKSKIQIAFGNVLPHLFATMVIHLFIETSRVLIILAELGVLGLLVGTITIDPFLIQELNLDIIPAYYPEWGSMLATARYAIGAGKIWIVFYPALAIFISVLGFNLLGEGLKIELNKRNSKFITFIKHIPYHLSPITFVYQIKNINRYKKSVGIKLGIIGLIVLILIWPVKNSKYNIESDDIYSHIQELSEDKYLERQIGSEGNENTRNYIVQNLKDIGLRPLYDKNFTNKHQIKVNSQTVKKSEIYIDGKNISFEYLKDFNFWDIYLDKIGEKNYTGELRRKIMTVEMYESGEYDPEQKYLLIVDEESRRNFNKITNILIEDFVSGGLYYTEDEALEVNHEINIIGSLEQVENSLGFGDIHINVSNKVIDTLKGNIGEEIVFSTDIEMQKYAEISNIGAILQGENKEKAPLIIATDYDYKLDESKNDKNKGLIYNGTSIAANLEIAKTLKNSDFRPDRDIIFMFFDGSTSSKETGLSGFVSSDLYDELEKNHFLIYTKNLGKKESKLLAFDTSRLYSDNRGHYGIVRNMMKRGEDFKLDTMLVGTNFDSRGVRIMYNNGTSLTSISGIEFSIEGEITTIDKEVLKVQTQTILDAITMYDYTLMKNGE